MFILHSMISLICSFGIALVLCTCTILNKLTRDIFLYRTLTMCIIYIYIYQYVPSVVAFVAFVACVCMIVHAPSVVALLYLLHMYVYDSVPSVFALSVVALLHSLHLLH